MGHREGQTPGSNLMGSWGGFQLGLKSYEECICFSPSSLTGQEACGPAGCPLATGTQITLKTDPPFPGLQQKTDRAVCEHPGGQASVRAPVWAQPSRTHGISERRGCRPEGGVRPGEPLGSHSLAQHFRWNSYHMWHPCHTLYHMPIWV